MFALDASIVYKLKKLQMIQLNKVDSSLKNFVIKILIMAFCWKLLHLYVLGPTRIPDKYLTDVVTIGTVYFTNFINFLQFHVRWMHTPFNIPTADGITNNGVCFFIIEDSCNGIEIMLIYIGILLFLPTLSKLRKIYFITGGLIVLILANIIRCTALMWLYLFHRPYFDINHHYIFTFIMYGIIIAGWLLYLKKNPVNEI